MHRDCGNFRRVRAGGELSMQSTIAVLPGSQASETERVWLVPLLVGAAVYLVVCIFARSVLNDGDTLTHIVIGRWIARRGMLMTDSPQRVRDRRVSGWFRRRLLRSSPHLTGHHAARGRHRLRPDRAG